jgi:hypothetical protein
MNSIYFNKLFTQSRKWDKIDFMLKQFVIVVISISKYEI